MDRIKELAVIFNNYRDKEYVENCTIEEMSELTKAIMKSKRSKLDINNLVEEIGHVLLTTSALISLYGISEELVTKSAEDAVKRMFIDIEREHDIRIESILKNIGILTSSGMEQITSLASEACCSSSQATTDMNELPKYKGSENGEI